MIWVGRTVGEVVFRINYIFNIWGIKESGRMNLSITPDTGITDSQTMLVLGSMKQIQKVFHI